jgi:hypothetical protein
MIERVEGQPALFRRRHRKLAVCMVIRTKVDAGYKVGHNFYLFFMRDCNQMREIYEYMNRYVT